MACSSSGVTSPLGLPHQGNVFSLFPSVDASISSKDGLIEAHVKEYFEIARMCTSEI